MNRHFDVTPVVLAAALVAGCGLPVLPDVTVSSQVEDWRDEVIYQLLTDRFANGDPRNDHRVNLAAPAAYHGGDFQGVIDKMDYLEALGVTAAVFTSGRFARQMIESAERVSFTKRS